MLVNIDSALDEGGSEELKDAVKDLCRMNMMI